MAARLDDDGDDDDDDDESWLLRDVTDQLDLGCTWLRAKNTAKAASRSVSVHVDSKWAGLYHDNGSCLDIIVPFVAADRPNVLVLKTSPLTITDGRHTTETTLSPACRSHLRTRSPRRLLAAGSLWTVAKYTIRCTSYGPPRNHLSIILDAIIWVADRSSKLVANHADALNRSHKLAATLLHIHNARLHDDDRCLRSQPKEEEKVDDADVPDYDDTMAAADEPPEEEVSMDTQMPFGTQIQHPIRPRSNASDLSFVGINRLEPVLAGNTQRADLKPRSAATLADEQRKQAQLLSLLGRSKPQQPPSPQPSALRHTPEITSPRPRESASQRASREPIAELVAQPSQTPEITSPRPTESASKRVDQERIADLVAQPSQTPDKPSVSLHQPKHPDASQDTSAIECPWMKGLTLNRAAATVPDDQTYILSKPESWAKQSNFPDPNIPMNIFTVLSRTIDENAALEGATSSGSFHETPSSASYPANSAPQPTNVQGSESEDEDPTSPVSWHTSPPPEPPERPTLPHPELPPDSSPETPGDISRHLPPSTLPASSQHDEYLPSSSPPEPLAALDSDGDTEMEISVPHALGEDLPQPTLRPTQHHVSRSEARSTSVVQVKKTPYTKSKNAQQPVVTVCPPTQESANHSSSASIVRGTYQELTSSAVEETRLEGLQTGHNDHHGEADVALVADVQDAQVPDDDAQAIPDDAQDMAMFDMFVHDEPTTEPAPRLDNEKQTRNLQIDITKAVQAQPEPTPMSAQLPLKDSSSGEQPSTAPVRAAIPVPAHQERRQSRQPSGTPSIVKRKHEPSPSREHRRSTKHKRPRPKYAFGGHDPQALIRERKERIERQKSTTSADSRQGSFSNVSLQQNADTKMEDVDDKGPGKGHDDEIKAPTAGAMSPRHQSLYATPSPVLRPAPAPPTATTTTDISLDQTRQDEPTAQTINRSASEKPAADRTEAPAQSIRSPELQSEPQEEPPSTSAPVSLPTPARPVSIPVSTIQDQDIQVDKQETTAPDDSALSVFDKFKAAYPEYKANVKHFTSLCKQMEELDREDRMVPKWMWDDFIIRNRTDFAQYAAECIEAGEEPIKYIRFYKDRIRDALHKKDIIGTRAVLLKALEEVGVHPTRAAPGPPSPVQQATQPPSGTSHRPQSVDTRHPRRPSVQQSSHGPAQSPPRHSSVRQTLPMPPPPQPVITPPKKASRRSLPFASSAKSTSERINGKTPVRHSLPASSFRAAPASTPGQTPAARSSHSQRRARSSFGDSLRQYAAEPSASPLETGTGDEYRDFIKAQEKLTATTGSKRVDKSKPWPRSLDVRPSVRDLPRRKIDVLEWKDEL